MRIVQTYSHMNGYEWIQFHRKSLWDEIVSVVEGVDASEHITKKSKEARMKGRMLFSPGDLNNTVKSSFDACGWEQSRTDYWVTDDYELIQKTKSLPRDEQKKIIEATGRTPIASYNQTDFVKDRVAVEVQFGKYAFIAYDLFVKHLAFYVGNHIDLGIEILPMKSMQQRMSSGPGYFEGALYDLARQGRGVPSVPLILVGIDE